MKRFIEGEHRSQSTLFPERVDDYIAEDNAVRVVDAFVNKLDVKELGFSRAQPSVTGRPVRYGEKAHGCRSSLTFAHC